MASSGECWARGRASVGEMDAQAVDDKVGRHVAGDLAGPVSAHAVSQRHDPDLRSHHDAILIELAHVAGIGQADRLNDFARHAERNKASSGMQ